ncbi:frequency clock protein [Truncatella angustata]|uniref:Frequency clock protein n=1 Tax=Truncatella angustata TaxID=152316 RepID=A0A9P8UD72_9PEZI|nr:frequency clock protein [Truncatella angustata]KAH6647255.1 frequency clock protein [Truncatella angustata]
MPSASQPSTIAYSNPRRTSPENSITLRHHRLAREASKRNASMRSMPMKIPKPSITNSPRRNSSDESNDTRVSDPRRWFDNSNRNVYSTMDSSMDVDPPYFQKQSESSTYRYVQSNQQTALPHVVTDSSVAEDYRGVIDDLTIENQRLKEELKRYRQMGPDALRRDKLFEVKVHGLPSRKKRQLENALRDFTASLEGSSARTSPARKKDKLKSVKGLDSTSKHASSSSGSNNRANQADSAYASMSTGAGSLDPTLPTKLSRTRSANNNTVERYLQDIPEGLLSRSTALTEKDKKKLVVRRLEQIFTGNGLGHTKHTSFPLAPAINEEAVGMSGTSNDKLPLPMTAAANASREAHILPQPNKKQSHSRDNVSPSHSNEDVAISRNATGSGSGSNHKEFDTTASDSKVPEQRATRPNDLDPDRPSIPSENMDYIRHLGLVAPEERQYSASDVAPDAEGWVYLNLLCSMAQLHMLNVTPAFIRSAVNERSRLFQLSPDGRSIRWRGGGDGTRFSSDDSGHSSKHGNSSPESDGTNEEDQRKRLKVQPSGNNATVSEPSKLVPQVSSSSDEFHYKPMFARHLTSSSDEQPSLGDETASSIGLADDSNLGMASRWNYSGISGMSQRKRRRDGAIIYYTGAPFCTDLSGDYGVASNGTSDEGSPDQSVPEMGRSGSHSSIPFKPLSEYDSHRVMMDLDFTSHDAASDETGDTDEIQADFPWSDLKQSARLMNLEASGLGGVTPDDHFVIAVSTRRPKFTEEAHQPRRRPTLAKSEPLEAAISKNTADSIVARLAIMSTGSPIPLISPVMQLENKIDIQYLGGVIHRLPAVPLPPPAFYFGSASSSFDSVSSDFDESADDVIGRRLLLQTGEDGYLANEELSSDDEEDEHSDDEGELGVSGSTSPNNVGEIPGFASQGLGRRSSVMVSDMSKVTTGSSVATAGGAMSDHSSMGDL